LDFGHNAHDPKAQRAKKGGPVLKDSRIQNEKESIRRGKIGWGNPASVGGRRRRQRGSCLLPNLSRKKRFESRKREF